jgi:hypothetical protein
MSSPLPLPNARRDLMYSLVDDATMLDLEAPAVDDAVAGYRHTRVATAAPLLGSFHCPATRLIELSGALVATMAAGEAPWPIAVVVDGDLGAAVTAEQAFAATMEPAVRMVRTLVRAGEDPAAAAAAATTTASLTPVAVWLDVATGPARNPTVAIRFIAECHRRGVPLVPWGPDAVIRSADTDRPGVLNLLAAAGLMVDDAPETRVVAVLGETDPTTFRLGRAGLTWRYHTIGAAAVRRVRACVMPAIATSRPNRVLADMSAAWCADIRQDE